MPGADVLQLQDGLIACFGTTREVTATVEALVVGPWEAPKIGLNEKGNSGVLEYSG